MRARRPVPATVLTFGPNGALALLDSTSTRREVLRFGSDDNVYLAGRPGVTDLFLGNGNALVVKNSGNTLLGKATDAGNGRLQFADHTTNAGGIGLGSDVSFYRSAASVATLIGHLETSGRITSNGPTGGIGYHTGAGGTVTQASTKGTGVTLNTVCGTITTHNAALAAATNVAFTLTDSAIAATDQLVVQHVSGGSLGAYLVFATPAAGSAVITIRNISGGSLSEALLLRFVVIKSVNT